MRPKRPSPCVLALKVISCSLSFCPNSELGPISATGAHRIGSVRSRAIVTWPAAPALSTKAPVPFGKPRSTSWRGLLLERAQGCARTTSLICIAWICVARICVDAVRWWGNRSHSDFRQPDMAWSPESFLEKGKVMKAVHIVLALPALAPLSAARARRSRHLGKVASHEVPDGSQRCEVGELCRGRHELRSRLADSTRAPRALFSPTPLRTPTGLPIPEDSKGAQQLRPFCGISRIGARRCKAAGKTMVKLCDAAKIGEAIEAAKP